MWQKFKQWLAMQDPRRRQLVKITEEVRDQAKQRGDHELANLYQQLIDRVKSGGSL